MDDLKLYATHEKYLTTLLETVEIYTFSMYFMLSRHCKFFVLNVG